MLDVVERSIVGRTKKVRFEADISSDQFSFFPQVYEGRLYNLLCGIAIADYAHNVTACSIIVLMEELLKCTLVSFGKCRQ